MRIVRCHYCDGTGMTIDTELAPGEPLVRPQAPTPPANAPRQELPPPMPQQAPRPVQASVQARPGVSLDGYGEPPHPATVGPGQYAAQVPQSTGTCPVHNVAWKTVPAGKSARTGKDYDAFQACPEMGCKEKPRR